jgi:hypothetical protein
LDHKKLLEKLENIGIRGKMLDLFASYLNKRLFCVKIDGRLGVKVNIDSGVPQDSILGPLLFIIYLNDLFPHINVAKILVFADDIPILYQHKDLNRCSTRMQLEADAFNEWAHDNGEKFLKTFFAMGKKGPTTAFVRVTVKEWIV